ncbi:MAG: histidinol phosphate phosphatase domain-containing protein [Candidatus Omnitrophica bacterium]|nr:histidinol phosphate phosphatase domain-containing protein [Candidatus Omnitrophota bacterium]
MIDLHTHTLLSDGCLLPAELVRRAVVAGYKAIALTDHVDHSNIDATIEALARVSEVLNRYWDIFVIPGVEITHVPVEVYPEMVKHARARGAGIVIGHGESPVEPVVPGTNEAAIRAGVDILAHPGDITRKEAALAAEETVYLEITTREGHCRGNAHVFDIASEAGAPMVLNTDSHSPADLMSHELIDRTLGSLTQNSDIKEAILRNSETIVFRVRK